MSVVTALARIDEIQQRIMSLAPESATTAAAAATAGTSATAGAFASAVEQIRGALNLPTGGVTGEDVVAQAKKYLGVPYVFGGEDASGMDCSGLVQRVLADLGIDAPRVVQDQADIGVEVGSLAEARPGDLLVTNGEKHIVIYAGDGKIIHAPSPGKNVELRNNYLTDADIQTIRRVVPAAQPAPAAATAPAALFAAAAGMASAAGASSPASPAPALADFAPIAASFGARSLAGSPIAAASAPVFAAPTTAPAAAFAAGTLAAAAAPDPVAAPGRADLTTTPTAAAAPAAGPAPTEVVDAPPPAAPAARTPLAQQVTAPVLSLARAGDGQHTLTLRVSPDNLGPVTVTAQISGSSLTIELATPSEMGREALRALLVDLRRDLAALAPHASILLAGGDSATGGGQGQNQGAAPWSAGAGTGSGSPGTPEQGRADSGQRGERPSTADAPPPPPAVPAAPGAGIDLFA